MILTSLNFVDEPQIIPSILDFAQNIGATLQLDSKKLFRLRVALEEIITSRLHNAYKNGGLLTLEIASEDGRAIFTLRDKGEPYWVNASKFDPKNVTDDLEGLENFLVANMVDEFANEKLGQNGQQIILKMHIENEFTPTGQKLENKDAPPLDTEFSILRVIDNDEDVIEVISCIYDEYGYSYGNEGIYYIDSFKKLAQEDKFISFIVKNAHNEVGAHGALITSDKLAGMVEMGALVVKHRFRGYKMAGTVFNHRLEEAKRMGFSAIWSAPVAYHTASQHNFVKNNFTATGFRIFKIPADLESDMNQERTRLSGAITVKLLDENFADVVYVPDYILPFTTKVLQRLGGNFEIKQSNQPPEPCSEMSLELMSRRKYGMIVSKKSGADFAEIIRVNMALCRKQRMEVVEVMLNLRDPSVAYSFDVLKKLGFVFGGLLPGSTNGTYAIMQHFLGIEPDYDCLQTEGDFTEVATDLKELYIAQQAENS